MVIINNILRGCFESFLAASVTATLIRAPSANTIDDISPVLLLLKKRGFLFFASRYIRREREETLLTDG